MRTKWARRPRYSSARVPGNASCALARPQPDAYPERSEGRGIALVPFLRGVAGYIRPVLLVLPAAVRFVSLIACVTIADLLLARTRGRARALAFRSALGATRRRMV